MVVQGPEDVARADESERVVLGMLLRFPDETWPKIGGLKSGDFFLGRHRVLFVQLVALRDQGIPIDIATVVTSLRKEKRLEEAGDITYLSELHSSCWSSANTNWHTATIVEASRRRELRRLAQDLVRMSSDGSDVGDVEALTRRIGEAGRQALEPSGGATTLKPARLGEFLSREDDARPEEHLAGRLGRHERRITVAPPKAGKSLLERSLALSLATAQPFAGLPVTNAPIPSLWVDLEEGETALRNSFRLLSRGLGLSDADIERAPLHIISVTGFDLPARAAELGALVAGEGIEHVVIDTLRRAMPPSGKVSERDSEYGAVVSNAIDRIRAAADGRVGITLIAHVAKGRGDASAVWEGPRGTGDLAALVDSIWELQGRIEDGATLRIVRRRGSCPLPLNLRLLEEPGQLRVLQVDAEHSAETAASVVAGVLINVGRAGLSRGELDRALKQNGLSKRQIPAAIKKAQEERTVVASPEGRQVRYYATKFAPPALAIAAIRGEGE